jgi:hypothetical protein
MELERASVFRHGSGTEPGGNIAQHPAFRAYLKREGLSLAEWEQRQAANAASDIDGQVLRLQRRKLQQQQFAR